VNKVERAAATLTRAMAEVGNDEVPLGTEQDLNYDFDCPQYIDFSQADGSWEGSEEEGTVEEGYFVSRPSDASDKDIPQDWIENLKATQSDENEDGASESETSARTLSQDAVAPLSARKENTRTPMKAASLSPQPLGSQQRRYATRSTTKARASSAKRKAKIPERNDENNLVASNKVASPIMAKVDAMEEVVDEYIMDEYVPDLSGPLESPGAPPPLISPLPLLEEGFSALDLSAEAFKKDPEPQTPGGMSTCEHERDAGNTSRERVQELAESIQPVEGASAMIEHGMLDTIAEDHAGSTTIDADETLDQDATLNETITADMEELALEKVDGEAAVTAGENATEPPKTNEGDDLIEADQVDERDLTLLEEGEELEEEMELDTSAGMCAAQDIRTEEVQGEAPLEHSEPTQEEEQGLEKEDEMNSSILEQQQQQQREVLDQEQSNEGSDAVLELQQSQGEEDVGYANVEESVAQNDNQKNDDTLLAESDDESLPRLTSVSGAHTPSSSVTGELVSESPVSKLDDTPNSQIGRPPSQARHVVPAKSTSGKQSFMMATKSAAQRMLEKQAPKGDKSKMQQQTFKTRLTEPKTPQLRTTNRSKPSVLQSTTTMQLERMALEKRHAAAEREKRNGMYVMAKAPPAGANAVPKKKLTEAATPKFVSARRPGAKRAEQLKRKGMQIRPNRLANATTSQKSPVKITRPSPFKLSTDSRVEEGSDASKNAYVPLAAQVRRFQTKTPARFHPKKPVEMPAKAKLQLTEPTEVHFATDARKRSAHVQSSAELEEKSLKEVKPFKARPLNRKILESAGDLGVPKVEKRKPCVAKEFQFQTERRASRTQRPSTPTAVGASSSKVGPTVKRPASSGGFTMRPRGGSVSTASSWSRPQPTEPKPFSFATDARNASRPAPPPVPNKDELETQVKHKARPMPNFSLPPKLPVVERKSPVKPQEFQLPGDRRHEEAQRKLAESIRREEEELENARRFKARPFDLSQLTSRKSSAAWEAQQEQLRQPKLTEPHTPKVLERSLRLQEEKEQRRRMLEAHEVEQHSFQARPLPRTTFEPGFSPELPHRLAVSVDPCLATDNRAPRRAEFDHQMMEKLRIQKEEEEREEQRKREEEEEAIREYRRSLVVKARPMPNYSKLAGAPKFRTPPRLTQPESPWLETKRRANHVDNEPETP